MKGGQLQRIVERHCEKIRQNGSHATYLNKDGDRFQFSYHQTKDVTGNMVRKVLVVDVGLTESEALREVS